MRIGILAEGFAEWQGGIDFLRTICDSLRLALPGAPPELVLLFPRDGASRAAHRLQDIGLRWLHESVRQRRPQPPTKALAELRGLLSKPKLARLHDTLGELPVLRYRDDAELERLARAHKLDALLPSYRALETAVSTPWLGYLFDFQHRHLPHLFAAPERAARDGRFEAMVERARCVVVNSRSVAADCERFLGRAGAQVVALPFGAAPSADWFTDAPERLARYALPERYFLVANQFWTHKNHRLVFEALRLLGDSPIASGLSIVCTGSTEDARDPGHFPSLRDFIDQHGLATRVRILGHIPKRDQIEVLKRSLAVVQPTLFEGGPGGGAVYDAVSLGVPALVSDLPVNRELDGLGLAIRFFDAGNANALADLLLASWCAPPTARPAAATLIAEGEQRRRAVGQALLDALRIAGMSDGMA